MRLHLIIIIDSAAHDIVLRNSILEVPVNDLERTLIVDTFNNSTPIVYGTMYGEHKMIIVENDPDNKAGIVVRNNISGSLSSKISTISFKNDKNVVNIRLSKEESDSVSRVTGFGMVQS